MILCFHGLHHTKITVNFCFVESKKVLEILRFLLNFHLFHNAVKTEIVDTTNFKIDMHNQWLSRLNQLKINQEEAKIRSEQVRRKNERRYERRNDLVSLM